jgi:hypothetical protein
MIIAMPAAAEDVEWLANVSVTSTWNGRTENLIGLPQRLTLPLGKLDMEFAITASDLRGFTHVRYRRLMKNRTRFEVLCALAALYIKQRVLMQYFHARGVNCIRQGSRQDFPPRKWTKKR